jgi:hypothetical protein
MGMISDLDSVAVRCTIEDGGRKSAPANRRLKRIGIDILGWRIGTTCANLFQENQSTVHRVRGLQYSTEYVCFQSARAGGAAGLR